MSLQKEIEDGRLKIHTDAYPMSIGELVSIYEDGDLEIYPQFQRIYRWNITQKSRLIESIFLGIPLPSIFVSQRDDGVWDVVDGLQRISTILSFMNKLKTPKNIENISFKAEKTHYLPSLENKTWEDIGPELQRLFKRAKIDVKIIKRESEPNAKFELFQRLNTGGTALSDQEVRNCLLLMINQMAFTYIQELSNNLDFLATLPISENKSAQALYQEFVIRYFIQRHPNKDLRNSHSDICPYFNDETMRLFDPANNFEYEREKNIFNQTFKIINQGLGEDAFKKFNTSEQKYKGPVTVSNFEVLTIAVAKCLEENKKLTPEDIVEASKRITEEFHQKTPSFTRPITKMNITHEIAQSLFNKL